MENHYLLHMVRSILSTPPLPGPSPPAIRRLPPCTTRGIGVKGLDMVRWPAPPPGDLSLGVGGYVPFRTRHLGRFLGTGHLRNVPGHLGPLGGRSRAKVQSAGGSCFYTYTSQVVVKLRAWRVLQAEEVGYVKNGLVYSSILVSVVDSDLESSATARAAMGAGALRPPPSALLTPHCLPAECTPHARRLASPHLPLALLRSAHAHSPRHIPRLQ